MYGYQGRNKSPVADEISPLRVRNYSPTNSSPNSDYSPVRTFQASSDLPDNFKTKHGSFKKSPALVRHGKMINGLKELQAR